MGIAAYNRGTRAISRYIDQQLKEARSIQPMPAIRDERERQNFIDRGRRFRIATERHDWNEAHEEWRAFRELVALEPSAFRESARQLFFTPEQLTTN